MNKVLATTALAALIVGLLAGFLWWGMPTSRLRRELRDAHGDADRLGRQVEELRAKSERVEAVLKTTEADLRHEKEMNEQLHLLVSEGKK